MPQNSNLNVSPYFDDFDENKNYQRVLFKPGTPIQARELTTLQSILQNQIEKFGSHFFKEGAIVSGDISYRRNYRCVQINDSHLGIPVSEYIDKLIGVRIQGQVSGVVAVVQDYITNLESEKSRYTLYIRYISSDQNTFEPSTFIDGENLIVLENINSSVVSIRENETFATTISSNSTLIGSAVRIEDGVYFIRGFFIKVPTQTIILDQYTNNPSYRVGLSINEEFAVASNDYDDLYDNASGFSNYAAPGADRLVVEANLIKKDIDDFIDENFIELVRVREGKIEKFIDRVDYNLLEDELARRTYDESGDYYVKPFKISIKESLDDRLGNGGVYLPGERTRQGNVASDDLACISISQGKAYVRGYEIETNNVLLDLEKPRTTARQSNDNIQFNFGSQLLVNNVYGSIPLEFSDNSKVFLYDERTTVKGEPSGNLIGVSRVYNYELRSSEYIDDTTQYYISLYDTELFTKITTNIAITLTTPAYIEGQTSGASGFLYKNVNNNTELTLYDVSGTFNRNERIIINGEDDTKIITDIVDYKLENVHQIVANTNAPGIGTFTADTVLNIEKSLGNKSFRISARNSVNLRSTITSSNIKFNVLRVGDIISYTKPGDTLPTYNRVHSIPTQTNNSFVVEPVSDVLNLCVGSTPETALDSISDINKIQTNIINRSQQFFVRLDNRSISNVDLSNTSITTKKTFYYNVSSSSFTFVLEDNTLSFESFDEENYNLTFSNTGNVVSLKEFDNITFTQNRKEVSVTGLVETGPVIFTATCKINSVSSRKKTYNRCNSLTINRSSSVMSGIGATTLDDGLTYSKVYGRRVQDKEISLNVPDVNEILAIYESSDQENPRVPTIILNGISSSLIDVVQGEKISGQTSGAIGYFVQNTNSNTIEYVNVNGLEFIIGESILFEESGVTASVEELLSGDKNITDLYRLDNGYRAEYLDFSRIVRTPGTIAPSKKLKIIFNNYTIDSSNSGDVITINSYDFDRYNSDLPQAITSDIIDLRPIVAPYSGNKSPFESSSRVFTDASNSSPHIFSGNSTINISYDYYLPRIDKLFLYKDGNFILKSGDPSINPLPPEIVEDALEVATFNIPAYLRRPGQATITLNEHKRYTMSDISRLENKVNTLESYTLLTLLEQDMKNLVIRDEETKLDKFKSGFFVDNFKSTLGSDLENVDYKSTINTNAGTLEPSKYRSELDLLLGSSESIGVGITEESSLDSEYNFDLGSDDVKRMGNIICLNYNEVGFTKNIFATRPTNINSFNNFNWTGTIKIIPSNDTWVVKKNKKGEINLDDSNYMRSRNIEIRAERLKPNTRFYAFFDNIDVTRYVVPKLIEIRMRSGSFRIGETVTGKIGNREIRFRVAPLNHKSGPIVKKLADISPNYKIETYANNIYDTRNRLPRNYSTTSTVLNVDIASLRMISSSDFYGYIANGMRLIGEKSKAVAVVNGLRLISDETGTFIGSFFIPNPNLKSTPKFETGTKEFILTTSKSNSDVYEENGSYAYSEFTSEPRLKKKAKKIEPAVGRTDNFIRKTRILNALGRASNSYPLAQTFLVDEDPGVYITKCDIFFKSKDQSLPVTIQIRTIEYGIPTQEILPYSEVTLTPDKIRVSNNGRTATTFNFESPVFLEGGKSYAIVLVSPSSYYTVWISKMGEVDITTTNSPEKDKIIVSQQPSLGVLYKSQNASTWSEYQDEDLKFNLYRANFTSNSGIVKFYNADLNVGNGQVDQLPLNPIYTYSRKGTVSIGKSFTSSDQELLSPGSTITQTGNPNFKSNLIGIGGSITVGATLVELEPTVKFGNRTTTYTNVELVNFTGYGNGGRVSIAVSSGVVTSIVVTQGGSGYLVGDVLKINTNSTGQLGKDLLITIPDSPGIINQFNSLVLDNIQGTINVNTSNNIVSNGTNIQSSPVTSPLNVIHDGLHFKVSQENHGMYSYENFVTLVGIEPDVLPVKLTSNVNLTDTQINVSSVENFTTFENLPVNSSNPGYILINSEIIRYTGVNLENNSIIGVQRDVNSFNTSQDPIIKAAYYSEPHSIGDNVFKYEFNGVSLRRINTTHNLNFVDKVKYPISMDNYHIKLDMSSPNRGSNTPQALYFKESNFSGTSISNLGEFSGPKSSKNLVMTSLETNVQNILPKGTSITGRIRTISGTSVSGNERSFIDNGFQTISLEGDNVFQTPRMICSKINENAYLDNLPGKKSFTLELSLRTNDRKISPIIDLDGVSILTSMNRIDSPIIDYGLDNRVNLVGEDPHSAIYVTKLVTLKEPAEDLRVYFDAYRHETNNIRVAYRVIRDNMPPERQGYELFPGYRNIDENKNRLNNRRNDDGLPDSLVGSSINFNDYKSYEYTAKNIPAFTGFQIKIMMSGTDQTKIPLIKNFRVTALA